MTYFHLTLKSDNAKTGPIPVTVTGNQSCPPACVFRKGSLCYAKSGPLAIHWKKVTEGYRGTNFNEFCQKLSELLNNQLFRLNAAGDLPGKGNRINGKQLNSLVKANSGKRGFSYTHKPVLGNSFVERNNRKYIKAANKSDYSPE